MVGATSAASAAGAKDELSITSTVSFDEQERNIVSIKFNFKYGPMTATVDIKSIDDNNSRNWKNLVELDSRRFIYAGGAAGSVRISSRETCLIFETFHKNGTNVSISAPIWACRSAIENVVKETSAYDKKQRY